MNNTSQRAPILKKDNGIAIHMYISYR